MSALLLNFEMVCSINVAQAAKFLAIPAPTYYQYRRTGKMPDCVKRQIEVLLRVPEPVLQSLISEYVFDGL